MTNKFPTDLQYRVLSNCKNNSAKWVAWRAGTTTCTTQKILKKLIEQGLVKREKGRNPTYMHSLTKEGERLLLILEKLHDFITI